MFAEDMIRWKQRADLERSGGGKMLTKVEAHVGQEVDESQHGKHQLFMHK